MPRQDWYFALALAVFVGTLVWFGRSIQDFLAPAGSSLVAPTLVGQNVNDAIKSAERSKLKAAIVEQTASDQFPKDVVIRQDPEPGADVRAGRQISLVVSTGLQLFPMPDLRYESLREVGLDLSHAKLLLGKVRFEPSDEVPANRVVSQNPAPLSTVRVGSTVDVVLAKGGPQNVKAPNFVGLDVDTARDEATRDHVRLGQLVWTPFGRYGAARGEVVRQSPPAGAMLDASQTVSLQVSAGPGEAGFIVRQVHATVVVPEPADGSGRAQVVRVEVQDETGRWNVYNAYAQPKQKLDFNLTVVGTSRLDTYVDNELLASKVLGTEPPALEKQTPAPNKTP